MATQFESNAEEFAGATPSSASHSSEIPEAPKLSNSTRRIMSAREVFAEQAYDSSSIARRDSSLEKRRLEIDAARSQIYDQDMERRRKEAEWYDREETRRQGMAAMDRISKLMPSSPSYLEEKSKIMGDLPMAGLDKNVAAVFQVKDSIYEEARKNRDEAKRIDDELQKSKASTDYSVAAQAKARDDGNLLNDEREARKRVSAMPVEAREAFKSARAAGLDFWEAEAAANDVKSKNVTPQDYNSALRTNLTLSKDNNTLRKQMEGSIAEMTKFGGPVDQEKIRPYLEAIEENEKLIQSNRDVYITPYDERQKAMRGEQGPKQGATEAATKGVTRSLESVDSGVNDQQSNTIPISETPTVPLSDAVKKNPNIKPGQFVTVPVKDKQGKVVATKTYLVTQ